VAAGGAVTIGGRVSRTSTWNDPDADEPLLSVAVQVTVVWPSGKIDPDALLQVTGRGPSMTSDPSGAGENVTCAPQSPFASAVCVGGTLTVGAASVTVTVNGAEPVLPRVSEALQFTRVEPIGKVDPEAGLHVTGRGPSIASLADAENVTAAPAALVATVLIGPGTVTVGGWLSETVTWKVALPVLPAASLAEQVTVVAPIGNIDPDAGLHVTGRGPSTASDAEAENVTAAPAALEAGVLMFAGTVTVGGCASVTVTRNVAVPVLPAVSVAEQVTVVAPTGNVDPDAGLHVNGRAPSIASDADAENVTTAPAALVDDAVMSPGTVTVGPCLSATVTLNVRVAELPAASDAVHVTVVTPSGNVDPDAGVQLGVIDPETASDAEAENVTTTPPAPAAAAVMSPGIVIVGAVVSETTTWKSALPAFPAASVAEHVTLVDPSGKVEPDAGVQVGVRLPSTSSVAEAENDTAAPEPDVASAVTGEDGTVTVGGVVSGPGSCALAAEPSPSATATTTIAAL
jgi:hypothetical protein